MRKNKRGEKLVKAILDKDDQELRNDAFGSEKFDAISIGGNSEPPISQALYNGMTSGKETTFNDSINAAEVSQKASELQATVNREIDNAEAQNNIQTSKSQNGTTIIKADGGPITDADFAKYQTQPNQVTTTETVQTEQPVGNAMSNIGQVVSIPSNQTPSYLGTTNANEVGDIVVDKNNYYNSLRNQVDPLVVEQLGVQDYYPDINRNIGVGTFSGKRIGSQTIYAGGGVLLPMGLYDARIRALDKRAKEKQAEIDKFNELPDVPDQIERPFKEYYMNRQYEWLDKYNNNYSALKKDRNFQREMQQMKDRATELNYTDKYVGSIVEQLKEGKGWVPKWAREKAYQWKSATMDDVDDIVSGKKNVLPLVNQIRSYEDGTKWADDFAKQNFVEGKMGQTPLVFKEGSVKTPKDEQDYNDFVKAVKTRDYDKMITGFRKFYDTSAIDSAIDAAFNTKNLDPETKEAITSYLLAQVPQDRIEMKQEIVKTDNLGYANLEERKRQFDATMAYKQEQGETHYEALNNTMNEEKNQNGRTYSQELASIRGTKGISEQEKRKRIKQAAESFGLVWSPTAKTYVRKELIPQSAQKDKPVTGDQLLVNVYEPIFKRVVKNGVVTYVEDKSKKPQLKSIPLNEMIKKKAGLFKDANGVVIDAEYQKEWADAMKQGRITFSPTQTELSTGWSDNGEIKEVNSSNVQNYDPSQNRNIIRFVGTATTDVDAEGNALEMRKPLRGQVYVQNDISTQQGRENADKIWGYTPAQLMKAGTTNTGSSSYSSTPK